MFPPEVYMRVKPPRLGYLEEVGDWRLTDNLLTLKINRVKSQPCGFRGRDSKITKRGWTLHSWAFIDGSWIPLEPLSVWWSTDELYTVSVPRQRDVEWERMGLASQ